MKRMKRKYNHKIYRLVQKGNKILRDKLAPDPGAKFKRHGTPGKVIGWLFNKLIAKPAHIIAYAFVGLFYHKDKQTPYVGSFLYVLVYFLVMGLIVVSLTQ